MRIKKWIYLLWSISTLLLNSAFGQIGEEAFLYQSGVKKISNKNYKSALNDCNKAILINANDNRFYRCKGDAEQALGKYQEAYLDYTKALELNNRDTLSYYGRGSIKALEKNYGEAIKDFSNAILLDSISNGNLYFDRGDCYRILGSPNDAQRDIERCLRINPHIISANYLLGDIFFTKKMFETAIKYFDIYIKHGENLLYDAYYYKGRSYLYLKDKNLAFADSSIVAFKKALIKKEPNSRLCMYLAEALSLIGDSIESRKNFNESVRLDSNNADAYFQWAIYELSLKHLQKSEALLLKAESKSLKPSPWVFYYLGKCLLEKGDTTKGLERVNKSIDLDSNIYIAYKLRVKYIKHNLKNKSSLLANYSQMVRLTSNKKELAFIYYTTSFLKSMSAEKEGAFNDINRVIELMPNEPVPYLTKALYLLTFSELKKNKAMRDIDKAISLNDKSWQAYYLKAKIEIERKRKRACPLLQKVNQLGGNVDPILYDYICGNKKLNSKTVLPLIKVNLTFNPLQEKDYPPLIH